MHLASIHAITTTSFWDNYPCIMQDQYLLGRLCIHPSFLLIQEFKLIKEILSNFFSSEDLF